MAAALKFVDTKNIMVDCLHRDPGGPCPLLLSNRGTKAGNISLKNSAQKTHNPIKGTSPSPLPFYCAQKRPQFLKFIKQFVLLALRGNMGSQGRCSSLSPIAPLDFFLFFFFLIERCLTW